jgi:hypothetical protein
MVIWYNLWPFGIVCGHLLYFFPFWYVWTKKNLATLTLNRTVCCAVTDRYCRLKRTFSEPFSCFSIAINFAAFPGKKF